MSTTFRRGAGALVAGLLVAGGGATAQADSHNANHAGYWEGFLEAEGYVDVSCTKVEAGQLSALGTVGEVDSDGDGDLDAQAVFVDDPWLLAVVKAGSTDASVEDENSIWRDVAAGDPVYHLSGKDISHIIGCTGEMPEDPTEPEPTKPAEPEPTKPAEPEPTKPAEPEPTKPAEPEPTKPAEPTHPAKPTVPGTPGGPGDDAGKPVGPVVQTDVPEQGVNPALPLAAVVAAGLGLAGLGLRRHGQEH